MNCRAGLIAQICLPDPLSFYYMSNLCFSAKWHSTYLFHGCCQVYVIAVENTTRHLVSCWLLHSVILRAGVGFTPLFYFCSLKVQIDWGRVFKIKQYWRIKQALKKQKGIPYIAHETQNSTATLKTVWHMSTQRLICKCLFTKNWKQPKYPSTGKWINGGIAIKWLLVKRNEVWIRATT